MRKLTDQQLEAMTLEEVGQAWVQLWNRADAARYEGYGERLMYWIENKRLAQYGLQDQPLPWTRKEAITAALNELDRLKASRLKAE